MGKTISFIIGLFFVSINPSLAQMDVKLLDGKWIETKREWVSGKTTTYDGETFKPHLKYRFDLKKRMAYVNFIDVIFREGPLKISEGPILEFDGGVFKIEKLDSTELILRQIFRENPKNPTAWRLYFEKDK